MFCQAQSSAERTHGADLPFVHAQEADRPAATTEPGPAATTEPGLWTFHVDHANPEWRNDILTQPDAVFQALATLPGRLQVTASLGYSMMQAHRTWWMTGAHGTPDSQ